MTSNWPQRIQQARDNRVAAMAAEAQTVRDAVDAGMKKTEVVAAYGTRNRQRIYAMLNANPADRLPPPLPPMVYLRGAGCGETVWDRVKAAMWARGWATVQDRTSAWHLARGGMTVVFVDFTAATGAGHSRENVTVGKVRARYGTDPFTGAEELELPLVNGGERPRPRVFDPNALDRLGHPGVRVLDADALARMVAEVLEEDHLSSDEDRVVAGDAWLP